MKIIGTKAKDTLVGSTGTDFINGKGGADVLVSNGGDDVMRGGKGADTFVFYATPEANNTISQILDFQPGKDDILIVAEGFNANVFHGYEESGAVSLMSPGYSDIVAQIDTGLYLYTGDVIIG